MELQINAGGRILACKARGLRGTALRDCKKAMREADRKLPPPEKKKQIDLRKKEAKKFNKSPEGKQQRRESDKKIASSAWKVFAKTNPLLILGRNSFLLLVKINMFGFASKLNAVLTGTSNRELAGRLELSKKWAGLGGDIDKLKDAVANGAKRKPIAGKVSRTSSFGGLQSYEWEIEQGPEPQSNFVDPATASIIGSAAMVIAVILPILARSGHKAEMDEESIDNIFEMSEDDIDNDNSLDAEAKTVLGDQLDGAEADLDDETNWLNLGISKNVGIALLAGLGIAAIVGIVLLIKKSK